LGKPDLTPVHARGSAVTPNHARAKRNCHVPLRRVAAPSGYVAAVNRCRTQSWSGLQPCSGPSARWDGAEAASKSIRYLLIEMLTPEIGAQLPARIIKEPDLKAYYIRDFELVPSLDGTFEYLAPFWNWLFCRLSPRELAVRLTATRFRVHNAACVRRNYWTTNSRSSPIGLSSPSYHRLALTSYKGKRQQS